MKAPCTGRDRQRRLVKELVHETAEHGRPRLVVISGVAGVGKTRLGWEFEKYVDGLSDVFAWHRGRCLSHGGGVGLWALAEALRARLGPTETEPGAAVQQAVDERLPTWFPDDSERDWVRPRLGVLLGTSGASFAREDLFVAWTRFLERVGGDNTVILVLDDMQYADDALLGFLDHVLATAGVPIHVIVLTRPELLERRPALSGGRRVTVLPSATALDSDRATMTSWAGAAPALVGWRPRGRVVAFRAGRKRRKWYGATASR